MELHSFNEDSVWYAPDYMDNRDLDDDKRFEVLIRPLSRAEFQRLEEKHGKIGRNGAINYARRYNKMRAAVIDRCVLEIRNLTIIVSENGTKKKINANRDDFLKYAAEPIVEDIVSAIKDQSVLAEGVLKKSDSQLGTSP